MKRFVLLGTILVVVLAGCATPAKVAQRGTGSSGSNVVQDQSPSSPTSSASASTNHGDIQVVAKGFTQLPPDSIGNSYISYGAVIQNSNADRWIAESVSVNLTFSDAAGTVVKSTNETVAAILPGQTVAVGDSASAAGATRLEVQALVGKWEEVNTTSGSFVVSGVNTTASVFGMKTNGTVSSTFAKDLKNTEAVAVYYNSGGQIIGGAFTFVDFIPAGGKVGMEVHSSESLSRLAKTEVYLEMTSLSLLG
jgi:hypothetical protein